MTEDAESFFTEALLVWNVSDTIMTRAQEILLLRRFKREDTANPSRRYWTSVSDYEFARNSYMRSLVDMLIERRRTTDESCYILLRRMYYELDDYTADPGERYSSVVHAYASTMESCVGELLRYIKEAEKDAED